MKIAAHVIAGLLGLLFIVFGLNYFLQFMPMPPPPPEGSPPALFMGALFPTGYLGFVKVLEVIGGLLVVIPLTRNLGLLVLGPIILNIAAFHAFLLKGEGLFGPIMLFLAASSLFLLWTERRAFLGLVRR
ncbi:MAG: hypothetical protein ACKO2G_07780 [Verrucomicrobiales bacterium]